MAEQRGYTIKNQNKDYPETNFTRKTITIAKKDMNIFHVLHELAHVFIGVHTNERSFRLNEAIAEAISIRVRQELGFTVSDEDYAYIFGHLSHTNITVNEFAKYKDKIEAVSKTIIKEIRKECYASNFITRGSRRPKSTGNSLRSIATVAHKSSK
jgi:Zn-dependent peptidase ImmA (M78 family)